MSKELKIKYYDCFSETTLLQYDIEFENGETIYLIIEKWRNNVTLLEKETFAKGLTKEEANEWLKQNFL